ncbi:MAG TPA: DUF5678 domain-containing protein [Anaerolineae bacterium]
MPAKSKSKSRHKSLKEKPATHYTAKRARDQMAVEFELDSQIQQHVGKWIALADNQIVAVGETVEDVVNAAKQLGYDAPLVVHGPLTRENVAYVL